MRLQLFACLLLAAGACDGTWSRGYVGHSQSRSGVSHHAKKRSYQPASGHAPSFAVDNVATTSAPSGARSQARPITTEGDACVKGTCAPRFFCRGAASCGMPVPTRRVLQTLSDGVTADVVVKIDKTTDTLCAEGEFYCDSTNACAADCGGGDSVGGQRDEAGCLVAAGYNYCAATGQCQRFWEVPCEASGETAGEDSAIRIAYYAMTSRSSDAPPSTPSALSAGSAGVCTARPRACMREFAPVCGCDGVDYPNRCSANAAGVDVARDGDCGGAW